MKAWCKMGKINILHLSDLHLSAKSVLGSDFAAFKQNLFASFDEYINDNGAIDLCLVTGDIINKGEVSLFSRYVLEFFMEVAEKLKLAPARFFFVPGNHDAVRDNTIKKTVSTARKGIFDDITTFDQFIGHYLSRYAAFCEFVKAFSGSDCIGTDSMGVAELKINEHNIRLILINSAICSYGNDFNKTGVSAYQLDHLWDKVSTSSFAPELTLALMHHPIEWHRLDERELLLRRLEEDSLKADIILHGHTHDGRVYGVMDLDNFFINLVSGIGYESSLTFAETARKSGAYKTTDYRIAFYHIDIPQKCINGTLRIASLKGKFVPDTRLYRRINNNGQFTISYLSNHASIGNSQSEIVHEVLLPKNAKVESNSDFLVEVDKRLGDLLRLRELLLQYMSEEKAEFLADKKEKDLNNKALVARSSEKHKELQGLKILHFRRFLIMICNYYRSILFQVMKPEDVRVHFRVYDKQKRAHVAFAISEGHSNLSDISWNVGKNLIYHAVQEGRSLLKSLNEDMIYDTKGIWEDFLTCPLHSYGPGTASGTPPLLSFGISIKGENAEVARKTLQVLSFIRVENSIKDLLESYSLRNHLYEDALR